MSAPEPDELADALKRAADGATPRPVDVDAVVRASRARRRSRRTAVVGGTVAVAGVLAVGGLVLGLQRVGGSTTADAPSMSESAESAESAPDATAGDAADDADGLRLAAPEDVNRCGAPVAAPTDAGTSPLVVTVTAPPGPVQPGTANPATVTVTNTGAATITGEIRMAPPLTVSDAGITVWHSSPDVEPTSQRIALAPGESASVDGTFETRACVDADDAAEPGGPLPGDLPALDPGPYGVGAVVPFTGSDGTITYLVSPIAPFAVG